MADQVSKLILKVEGEEEIKRLNDQLEKEREHLVKLLEIQRQGVVGVNPADIQAAGQAVVDLEQKINHIRGTTGAGGYGVLGLSYAFQDFTSVLAAGGGLQQAMGSISNNITGIGTALGATVGQAAKLSLGFTAFTAAIPIVKSLWDAFTSEGAKGAEDRLKSIAAEIDRATAAFEKLKGAPTGPEAETARKLTAALQERPTAERVRAALQPQFAGIEQQELPPEQQQRFQAVAERIAQIQARAGPGPMGAPQLAELRALRGEFLQLRQAGARRGAERVMQQAQVAGPLGDVARQQLFAAGRGIPGLEGISPDEIMQQQDRARDARNQLDRQMAMGKLRNDNAIARKKRIDELNRAGPENEAQTARERIDENLKERKEGIDLSRAIGKAYREDLVRRRAPINLQPLPLTPPNATPLEAAGIAGQTQMIMIENQAMIRKRLVELGQANTAARKLNRALQTDDNMGAPGRHGG